jgi:hypothetical protein
MVNEGLVAIDAGDQAMAMKKHWARVPLLELVDRIKDKTHDRVLKLGDDVNMAADLAKLKPNNVSPEECKQFTDLIQVTSLYYEISFSKAMANALLGREA